MNRLKTHHAGQKEVQKLQYTMQTPTILIAVHHANPTNLVLTLLAIQTTCAPSLCPPDHPEHALHCTQTMEYRRN